MNRLLFVSAVFDTVVIDFDVTVFTCDVDGTFNTGVDVTIVVSIVCATQDTICITLVGLAFGELLLPNVDVDVNVM